MDALSKIVEELPAQTNYQVKQQDEDIEEELVIIVEWVDWSKKSDEEMSDLGYSNEAYLIDLPQWKKEGYLPEFEDNE
ncbi:250_t:CDS:2, partial [Gigaspora margarita]